MKIIAVIFLFSTINCLAFDKKEFKLYGDTNLSSQKNARLSTNLNGEYAVNLHESKNKSWAICLNGKISADIDHLGNEIKTNVFTTFGFEF